MELNPVTYIYLVQVILRHNNNKVTDVDGFGDISALARSANINTGQAGKDPVSVYFNMRMKKNRDMNGENVDIIGGRLLTFGICGLRPNLVREPKDTVWLKEHLRRDYRHYLDLTLQFNNGNDSTLFFDVTDQIHRKFRGGVITVELDMDKIDVPPRPGGSAFNAVVKDYEEEEYEFEM